MPPSQKSERVISLASQKKTGAKAVNIHLKLLTVVCLEWIAKGLANLIPGGDSNIKKVGVLVVSLRGVNFKFWSRLGC